MSSQLYVPPAGVSLTLDEADPPDAPQRRQCPSKRPALLQHLVTSVSLPTPAQYLLETRLPRRQAVTALQTSKMTLSPSPLHLGAVDKPLARATAALRRQQGTQDAVVALALLANRKRPQPCLRSLQFLAGWAQRPSGMTGSA